MRRLQGTTLLVLTLVVVVGVPAAVRAASPVASGTPKANAVEGQKLFDADCAGCHKADGSGGIKIGRERAADLRAPRLERRYRTDALLRRAILEGKEANGEALDPAMPRWQGKLSSSQVNDVIGFLKTLKKK